jgi:peptide/nickel transport system substrate-binding protein
VNVRRAISMAIDRNTIVRDLLNPTINPVAVTFWDATPPFADPSLKPYPFDPAQSKQLLDAAGWKDTNGDGIREKAGVKLQLRYLSNERELRKNVQAVVKQQLAQVGVDVQLQTVSSDIFWNGYKDNGPQATGAYDMAQYSNNPAFPDPEASIDWLCKEVTSAENPEGLNWQGYCNPALDTLLDEQAKTVDRQKRIQLYYQIEKILYDDAITLEMWKDPDIWSIHSRLKNVKLSGATPFWNVTDWAIDSAY